MNERIDELMIQAGARFEFLHGVHYDDFQYRKFAKLLVRECADVCYQHSENAGGADTAFGYGYKDCGDDIKRIFGVV